MNDYNTTVAENWEQFSRFNAKSTEVFRSVIPADLSGTSVLDLGCGTGYDLLEYRRRGAQFIAGIDASEDMLEASRRMAAADWLGKLDMSQPSQLPQQFDVIVSKWALQAVPDYAAVLSNVASWLKPEGTLVLLVVHPLRQFMEKKRAGKNYFIQEVVDSVLFDGAVIVKEPTHTLADLLSPFFFQHFDLEVLMEGMEIGCEVVNGDTYPSYLLLKARRRK